MMSQPKKGEAMIPIPRPVNLIVVILLSLQLSACGTILYPERRNQDVGRIDVGVALLDGIWLLFGIIPGVIAFAVDFSTGAIYLPASKVQAGEKYSVVYFDPQEASPQTLERLISRETGQDFSFRDERLELSRLRGTEELPVYFARADR
jgi:hypothetical protein